MPSYVYVTMSYGETHKIKCKEEEFLEEIYNNEDYIVTQDNLYINKLQIADFKFEHKLIEW